MAERWRKATRSGGEGGNCVEIRWRKSTRSGAVSNCVELGDTGLIRDSKNPDGPRLAADLRALVALVKDGELDLP